MYNLENKICSFHVNDYHLVTILMPYIYEATKEEKHIITFFENDLSSIYEKVLNTNKDFWDNKEQFNKVEWKNLKEGEEYAKTKTAENGTIAIVSGSKEFVEKINKVLFDVHTNFTLVNCFEVGVLNKDEDIKIEEYEKMLNTKGLVDIKKMNLV